MRQHRLAKLIRAALVPAVLLGGAASSQAATAGHQNPAATEAAAHRADARQSTAYRAVRASKMIGMEVRNPEGGNLGKINDLIVDMKTGDVRYAMLEFDPGIFKGERLFAVPTNRLRMAADRDRLVYDMTRDKLEQAGVERAAWNSRRPVDRDYMGRVDKVWGVAQPSDGPPAHRASDLIGKDVRNRSGDDIGDVKDLVVDMGRQKVHYAVLAFDPGWTSPERLYSLPLNSLRLGDDGDKLVLDMDKSRLDKLKSFDESRYSKLDDRDWVGEMDRYLIGVVPVVVATPVKSGTSDGQRTSSNETGHGR